MLASAGDFLKYAVGYQLGVGTGDVISYLAVESAGGLSSGELG